MTTTKCFIILIIYFYVHQCCSLLRAKREVGKADDPLLTANLFEGDIAGFDGKVVGRVSDGENIWLNKEIPFKFDNISHVAKRAVQKSMEEMSRKTCIKFRAVTAFDQDHLVFVNGIGCSSFIGKHGGRQEISVGARCESTGTVLHLLMHALGFWHEQSRLDRDSYVLIDLDNIAPENRRNFEKYAVKMDSYDYESITHLSPYAYAIDKSKKTILTKDERFKVGQRYSLSQGDINAIARRYCGRRSSQLSDQDIQQIKQQESQYQESYADSVTNAEAPDAETAGVDGCRDLQKKCPLWATQGMCYKQRQNMITNCPASCLSCETSQPTKCVNSNTLCGMWAWMGHCLGRRSSQILKLCPLACGVCLPEGTTQKETDLSGRCIDRHQNCQHWSQRGRCFYQHVIRLCPSSCNKCSSAAAGVARPSPQPSILESPDDCVDVHHNCAHFKQKGQCTNQSHAKQKCRKTCGICTPQSSGSGVVHPVASGTPCVDNNPVLCRYLKSSSSVACLLEVTAKACPKSCGLC